MTQRISMQYFNYIIRLLPLGSLKVSQLFKNHLWGLYRKIVAEIIKRAKKGITVKK